MPFLLTSPECVAHHEAGHAVMCVLLGHAIKRVTIEPSADGASLGCLTSPTRRVALMDLQHFGGARGERYAREAIMICFAGPVAEQRWLHSVDLPMDWAGDESDGGQVRQLAQWYTADRRERRALATWLLARTRAALRPRSQWMMVRAVARSLLEHGTLSGRAVRELTRGRPPPCRRSGGHHRHVSAV